MRMVRWVAGLVLVLAGTILPGTEPPSWIAAVQQAVEIELAPKALPLTVALPVVDIVSTYDPLTGRMEGTMQVAFPAAEVVGWADLGFVLHANNGASYTGSSTTITSASVGGSAVEPRLVDDGRGVLLSLAGVELTGAWITCSLDFVTIVPETGGRAGLLTRDTHAHHLYSWLPEPAIYHEGWQFPAQTEMSDPSFVRCCDYRWRLWLPEPWTLVAGGHEERDADGSWLVLTPRARNLVASISDQPRQTLMLSAGDGGPDVRVFFTGKHTVPAAMCASVARDAFAIGNAAFGAYPRRSYDIVFTDFTIAVGGMEASGMTFIHRPMLTQLNWQHGDPVLNQQTPLLHAVIHEVMHSWWYDQVGNDTWQEPWLDEPLTEWSTWYVIERLRGRKAMLAFATQRLAALLLVAKELLPLDSTGDVMNEQQFGILLYCRGPLLYEALRAEIGDEAFFAALRDWYARHAGSVVARSDWDAVFLAALPAERRAGFAASWLTGSDDPVPAELDHLLPAGQAAWLREQVQRHRLPVPAP